MVKNNSIKRSLVASILILCLCFASFIGTTFAWFTDSVTSANNVIKTGNLDIEAEYTLDGKTWNDFDGASDLFQKGAWEPGHTEVVAIKITNVGSLALKYKVNMNIVEEIVGKSVLGNDIVLSDILEVSTMTQQVNTVGEIAVSLAFSGEDKIGYENTARFKDSNILKEAKDLAPNTSHYLIVKVDMPETVGNEANHDGMNEPSIEFGIDILATQFASENDSFGNGYDSNSAFVDEIDSVYALKKAFEKGGSYKLKTDIAGDGLESFVVSSSAELTLDLNGFSITNAVAGAPAIVNNGTLTINGDGAVVNGTNSQNKSHTIRNYGTLVINSGNIGTDDTAGAAVVNDGTATINGGVFASKQENVKSDGLCAYAFINNGEGTMTINDATLDGQTHGLFGAYAGKLIVNGGTYTMDGNGGLGCYVVYSTADAEVILVGGTVKTNSPRNNNVFFVYKGGNHFNSAAVNTDNITYIGTEIYLNGVLQTYTDNVAAISSAEELKSALAEGIPNIYLESNVQTDAILNVSSNTIINGNGYTISRAAGYTGTVMTVANGVTVTVENTVFDGAGANATGNLIATTNGHIVLGEGTVVKNNNGAHAIYLNHGSGKKGTLTLNGAQIINNSSDSGAIWGGGAITVNEGSKINNNSSTGFAGAIRMVSACNLTMNGGEISGNTATGDGGAIWGYGSSTYNFNGGKMNGNTSAGIGGAIYTGTSSVINISGDFELCDNTAANSGAIRLTDHTSMTITGGKISGNTQNGGDSNAFNTWNNTISITAGELEDNMSYVGGLTLTIGAADIDGVIAYDLSTNHNTAYLKADFNSFKFTVNENAANFAAFNFKPEAGYIYTEGDEDKLVCMNEGYETYWDAEKGVFKLQAK